MIVTWPELLRRGQKQWESEPLEPASAEALGHQVGLVPSAPAGNDEGVQSPDSGASQASNPRLLTQRVYSDVL